MLEAFADPSNVDDPDPEDNAVRKSVRILDSGADLAVTLSDSPDPVGSGEKVRYPARLQNLGPSAARQVYLEALLPEGGQLVSSSKDCQREGGSARLTAVLYSPAGQEMARTQRDLAPQGSLLAGVQDLLRLQSLFQEGYLSIQQAFLPPLPKA